MGNKIEEGKSDHGWKERMSAIAGGDSPGLHKSIQIGSRAINISRFSDDIFFGWEIEIADNSQMVVIYSLYDHIGLVEIEIPDKDSSEAPGLSSDFFGKSKNGGLERNSDGNYYFLADETDGEVESQTIAIVSYLEEQMARRTASP